jgi:pimeloyl-ACP methyl ester carboxylesterase
MHKSQLVKVDITGRTELPGHSHVAAWAVLPPVDSVAEIRAVLFGYPGGTYTKRYFHFEVPDHPGYSMADYLADSGFAFVACDPLGVGDSSRPSAELLTFAMMAAANNIAVADLLAMLGRGDLAGPPLSPTAKCIGVGHSSGGGIVTVQQANHRSFDGLAVLGHSAIKPQWPKPPAALRDIPQPSPERDSQGYVIKPRTPLQLWNFFLDDVPREVIAADADFVAPLPPCYLEEDGGMYGGGTSKYASGVDVPVFLSFAERDAAVSPHLEPTCYPRSPDVTLFLQPRAAHCGNFASSRQLLFSRLGAWTRSLVDVDAGPAMTSPLVHEQDGGGVASGDPGRDAATFGDPR